MRGGYCTSGRKPLQGVHIASFCTYSDENILLIFEHSHRIGKFLTWKPVDVDPGRNSHPHFLPYVFVCMRVFACVNWDTKTLDASPDHERRLRADGRVQLLHRQGGHLVRRDGLRLPQGQPHHRALQQMVHRLVWIYNEFSSDVYNLNFGTNGHRW